MASKKHYYKLADALGTFKYYLEHDDIDITDEFNNLVSGIMTVLKDDNKEFKAGIFEDEIQNKYKERYKEYIEEPSQKEYHEEISEHP